MDNNNNKICNSNNNLILIQNTLNKIKYLFEQKYKEYMFCEYKDGITFDNIQEYANDNLIINYNVITCDINNVNILIKKSYAITSDIIHDFYDISENFNKLMEDFNNLIEEKIVNIKIRRGFTDHEWKIMANHKHNNKFDYSQTKYKTIKLKVDVNCYIHGIFSQEASLHLKGPGCSKCYLESKNKKLPLEFTFSSSEKSKYWSPKNRLKPSEVPRASTELFIFDCNKCGHEFSKQLNTVQSGSWCPFCVNRKICNNDCEYCFDKSFASSPRALQWSDKNEVTPREVMKSAHEKYFFNCEKCYHELYITLNSVTIKGNWCIFCANKKLCESESCKICENKSFSGNKYSKYWSLKNTILPRMVLKSSANKYIFDCPSCNNEYLSSPGTITAGHWCGCTVNKTENKLCQFLKTHTNVIIEKEKKFDWCKNIKHLPFDIVIEQYKIIIECDGEQHFIKKIHFKTQFEEIQKTDKYKMTLAKKYGYSIIRIFQPDVWYDKNNWEQNLKDAIIKASLVIGDPIVIYIGAIYQTNYFTLD